MPSLKNYICVDLGCFSLLDFDMQLLGTCFYVFCVSALPFLFHNVVVVEVRQSFSSEMLFSVSGFGLTCAESVHQMFI